MSVPYQFDLKAEDEQSYRVAHECSIQEARRALMLERAEDIVTGAQSAYDLKPVLMLLIDMLRR